MNYSQFLSTQQAAEFLSLSPRTLERWRVEGRGPIWLKFGRKVTYRVSDLEKWAAGQYRRSTSDDGHQAA